MIIAYSPECHSVCPVRNTGPGPKPYPGSLFPGGLAKFPPGEVGQELFGGSAGNFKGRAPSDSTDPGEADPDGLAEGLMVATCADAPQPVRTMATTPTPTLPTLEIPRP